jgi:hypothetical protein
MHDAHSSAAVIHYTNVLGTVDVLVGPFRTIGDAQVAATSTGPNGATHAAVITLLDDEGAYIPWVTIYSATDLMHRLNDICGGWAPPATDEEMCWVVDLETSGGRVAVGPFAGKKEANSYANHARPTTDNLGNAIVTGTTLRPLLDTDLTPQDAILATHINSFGLLHDMTISAIADAS